MKINFYYLAHGFFVFNPKQVKRDYAEMKSLGADSITYAVLEQDDLFCPVTMEKHFELAHRAGLKVYVIFSRFGGLFAGAPRVPSLFSAERQDTLMRRKDGSIYSGYTGVYSCVNNRDFRKFFIRTTTRLLEKYKIDGVVFDEPKLSGSPCYCGTCRKLLGKEDPVVFRNRSVVKFLDDAAAKMKKINPRLEIALFNDTIYPLEFHRMSAGMKNLDYHGTDGSLSKQWVNKSEIKQVKTPLLEQVKEAKKIAEENGKKFMAVCENFQVPASEIPAWERNFEKVLEYRPDLLVFFYYAPNTDDPEKLHDMIARCCRKIKAK